MKRLFNFIQRYPLERLFLVPPLNGPEDSHKLFFDAEADRRVHQAVKHISEPTARSCNPQPAARHKTAEFRLHA